MRGNNKPGIRFLFIVRQGAVIEEAGEKRSGAGLFI
jgi:hypothetical protein